MSPPGPAAWRPAPQDLRAARAGGDSQGGGGSHTRQDQAGAQGFFLNFLISITFSYIR